jgi:hypothetical protein
MLLKWELQTKSKRTKSARCSGETGYEKGWRDSVSCVTKRRENDMKQAQTVDGIGRHKKRAQMIEKVEATRERWKGVPASGESQDTRARLSWGSEIQSLRKARVCWGATVESLMQRVARAPTSTQLAPRQFHCRPAMMLRPLPEKDVSQKHEEVSQKQIAPPAEGSLTLTFRSYSLTLSLYS